ncbi:hypothetical protein [Nonomuraea rubra]|uniref:hypothetical protein n=1 Tax=Nonomuraea rubra TaxID=46180 RepID=UPI0031EB053B
MRHVLAAPHQQRRDVRQRRPRGQLVRRLAQRLGQHHVTVRGEQGPPGGGAQRLVLQGVQRRLVGLA